MAVTYSAKGPNSFFPNLRGLSLAVKKDSARHHSESLKAVVSGKTMNRSSQSQSQALS